ncbi:MAG: cupin domain-containing protein [Gammaproteobacteria bacterium]|nr:cupin domain-containing protein [Gammaproteobacteria bacterium]
MPLTRLGPVAADSAEPYLPPPDRLIDGHPQQRAWVQFEDPPKGFYAGVWESEPGTWRIRYTEVEYCRILSGRSRITAADGTVTEVGPGDEFVIPSGFEGTWQVLERTRKTFVIHEVP